MRRWALASMVLPLLLAACAGGGREEATRPAQSPTTPSPPPPPEEECPAQTTITMNSRSFDPTCVEVAKGDTLTLENPSGALHSFTLDKPKVDLDVEADESGTYEVEGLKLRDYRFYCKYHAGMFVDVRVT
ncbi:MAG: cupredoxin domain-containing protein [Actinomycetota bacterium]